MAVIIKILRQFLPIKLPVQQLKEASKLTVDIKKQFNYSSKIVEHGCSYLTILKNFFNLSSQHKYSCNQRKILENVNRQSLQLSTQRYFWNFGRKRNPDSKKRVPKLILVQNPLSWLMIKVDFSVLRNVWDPTFQEKEFKYGTKQVKNIHIYVLYSEMIAL